MNLVDVEKRIEELDLPKNVRKKKEIKILSEYLEEGEDISYIFNCGLSGNNWLCTITSKKLLFLDKSMFNNVNKLIIPIDDVNYLSSKENTMDGEIIIGHGNLSARIDCIEKKELDKVISALKNVCEQNPNVEKNVEEKRKEEAKGPLTRKSLEYLLNKIVEDNEKQIALLEQLIEENKVLKEKIEYLEQNKN